MLDLLNENNLICNRDSIPIVSVYGCLWVVGVGVIWPALTAIGSKKD